MSLVFPSMVRLQILEQHDELRALVKQALAEAAASTGTAVDLERRTRELHGRFDQHLRFEEQALVPVLWAVDGWGPERVQDLRLEHARQRRELDAVIEGLESGWSDERLAQELTRLGDDLLRDMDEEEQGSIRADLLCDGVLTCERR
jgi:uncharacterized lipoprotein YmbA